MSREGMEAREELLGPVQDPNSVEAVPATSQHICTQVCREHGAARTTKLLLNVSS